MSPVSTERDPVRRRPLRLAAKLLLVGCALSAVACSGGSSGNNDAVALLPLLNGSLSSSATACPGTSSVPSGVALADTVTSAPGANTAQAFRDPALAVNGVCGAGTGAGSTDVYSIDATGANATLTLEWGGRRVTNGTGTDFIIFENPFNQNGNPGARFMEALVVEVQDDITGNWCGFAPDYVNGGLETVYSENPAAWQNFAGVTPVLYNQAINALTADDIFNASLSGGDHFDLSDLSAANQFSNGCTGTARTNILTNGFVFLRMRAATALINADSGSAFPQDPGSFGGGPDVDGVIARYVSAR